MFPNLIQGLLTTTFLSISKDCDAVLYIKHSVFLVQLRALARLGFATHATLFYQGSSLYAIALLLVHLRDILGYLVN